MYKIVVIRFYYVNTINVNRYPYELTDDNGETLEFETIERANEHIEMLASQPYCLAHGESGRPLYCVVGFDYEIGLEHDSYDWQAYSEEYSYHSDLDRDDYVSDKDYYDAIEQERLVLADNDLDAQLRFTVEYDRTRLLAANLA